VRTRPSSCNRVLTVVLQWPPVNTWQTMEAIKETQDEVDDLTESYRKIKMNADVRLSGLKY
jgi:hypothetical protein